MVASPVVFAELSMPPADSMMSFVASTFSFLADGVSIIHSLARGLEEHSTE